MIKIQINFSEDQAKWLIGELYDKLPCYNNSQINNKNSAEFIFINNILAKIVKEYNKKTDRYFNWQLYDPTHKPTVGNIEDQWL